LPEGRRRRNGVEIYDSKRFVTVTGKHLPFTPTDLQERTHELNQLYRQVFGDISVPAKCQELSVCNTDNLLELDDQELLEKAMNAENGAKFRALWNGDTSGYDSQSEADLALCRLLAFWCGNDPRGLNGCSPCPRWDSVRSGRTRGITASVPSPKPSEACAKPTTTAMATDTARTRANRARLTVQTRNRAGRTTCRESQNRAPQTNLAQTQRGHANPRARHRKHGERRELGRRAQTQWGQTQLGAVATAGMAAAALCTQI
jgi:hypothetical protein